MCNVFLILLFVFKEIYEMGFKEDLLEYEQLKSNRKVLEKKLENMRNSVLQRQAQVDEFRYHVEKEKHDYEVLERNSMKQIITKITGNYEAKLEKEYREYIAAKQHYDELIYQLEYANQEVRNLENEIYNTSSEVTNKLRQIKNRYQYSAESQDYYVEVNKLLCKRKEYEEAINAVRQTLYYAEEVMKHLKNASDASTWDMLGGELFADILKYSSLDKVGSAVAAMKNSAINMKAELSDINIVFDMNLDYIDNRTRTFDVLFDNFFSDIQVRDRISNNINIMCEYIDRLYELDNNLNKEWTDINSEVIAWNEQLSIM